MPQRPFFSIIIPALNEEKYLPKLLDDLINQTFQSFEVTIVDGHSDDQTFKKASEYVNKIPSLKVTSSTRRNVSIQRNMGAKLSRGEYLIFSDADNRLPKYFLEGLHYQLIYKPTDAFTCWVLPETNNQKDKTIATSLNLLLEASLLTKNPTGLGAMIGCKNSVFKKTTGFDPKIGFAEDTDFVRRVYKNGHSFRVIHDPRFIVSLRRYHAHGTIKVIQKSATLLLKYLTKQPIDQKQEYPMGGKAFKKSSDDNLITKLDLFLNKPIKKQKILEQLQSLIEFEE
ncbi:MAG: teichoic acid biosynthesis related protein [uncultured bacterium]|nr:MAG: teichoic acid biosynthesis related protein [uncultured bacterium]